jgi:hypothetical protein
MYLGGRSKRTKFLPATVKSQSIISQMEKSINSNVSMIIRDMKIKQTKNPQKN